MKRYICLAVFILLFHYKGICQTEKFSSQKPDFFVGSLVGTRVNIDTFKLHQEIKATNGLKFKSANIYFSGTNFQNVVVATIFGESLSVVNTLIDKCTAGTTITFDNVKLVNNKNVEIAVDGKSYFFYSGEFIANDKPSEVNKELFDLMKKNFISGTIYFSGESFPNVVTVICKPNILVKPYFDRCAPGSKIAFENCVYKNADGTLSKPITKILKLD